MGPNIKHLHGAYWDFFDHHLPLTEASLAEALRCAGFGIRRQHGRFLPFTMVDSPRYPLLALRAYLRLPALWRVFGKQFLLLAGR
jgi:hypothetical protein